MFLEILKSKIHRVKVTDANLEYIGSITIDEDLMDAADLFPYEKVHVLNMTNGERLETYVIKGRRGSGVIELNGPAAHKGKIGDIVIVLSYGFVKRKKALKYEPKIIFPVNNKLI
jgi:aspartate 1-decarboxylase